MQKRDVQYEPMLGFEDLVRTKSANDISRTARGTRESSGTRGIFFNQFLQVVHAQSILLLDEGIPIWGTGCGILGKY